MVDESPWPIYVSLGVFSLMVEFIEFVLMCHLSLVKISLILVYSISCVLGWFRDICYEGAFSGEHTISVQQGLKMGFVLFILSEVMFFGSFFWSLFYYSMTPSVEIGGWPPSGIMSVNPLSIPLLGTLILMSSGITVTWSHYSMMAGSKSAALTSLALTVLLGFMFTLLQLMEYYETSFSISDSVYGSIFYMATGFHGLHVIVGSVFLTVCLTRVMSNQLSMDHHAGFEFAIWYWHFVDVVWLYLYLCMYWWGW